MTSDLPRRRAHRSSRGFTTPPFTDGEVPTPMLAGIGCLVVLYYLAIIAILVGGAIFIWQQVF